MIKKSKKHNCADKFKTKFKEEMNLFKKIDSDLIIIDRLFIKKNKRVFS